MPIYEYVCQNCGDEFECLVFRDDTPECPQCHTKDLKKKMSAFGFSVGGKFTSSASSDSCSSCSSSSCST